MQIRLAQKHDGMKPTDYELKDLDAVVGKNGEIRAQDRLKHVVKLGPHVTHPMILRGKSAWAQALLRHVHADVFRDTAGTEQTLAEVRKRIWETRGREATRKMISQCLLCK